MDRKHSALTIAFLVLFGMSAAAQEAHDQPPASGKLLPQCAGIRAAAPHPTSAEIEATAEQGSSNVRMLPSHEPFENIATVRYKLRDYYDCTDRTVCYWTDVDAQLLRAEELLETSAGQRKHGEKLALVLDIDETSLSSYCEEIREDFGYLHKPFEDWIISSDADIPIPGTVRLTKRAHALGIDVFFITGRKESQRAATESNLRAAGYDHWRHLSLVQPDVAYASSTAYHSAIPYKSLERQKILDAGYRIVLNVGDQWSDLQGTAQAEHSVKLPNPFYYLP